MPIRPFVTDVDYMEPIGLFIGGHGTPLDRSYLPLDPGLTVLYGLNGSGKSYAMDCLRACLTGVQPRRRLGSWWQQPLIVARLPAEDRRGGWFERAWDESGAVRSGENSYHLESLLGDELPSAFNLAHDWYTFDSSYGDFEDLARDFAAVDTFAFAPTGTASPQWDFSPVLSSHQSPVLAAFITAMAADEDPDEAYIWAPVRHALHFDDVAEDMSGTYLTKWSRTLRLPPRYAQLFDDVISDDARDPLAITAAALNYEFRHGGSRPSDLGTGEAPVIDVLAWLPDAAEDIQSAANTYYSMLLRDAPALTLEICDGADWLVGDALTWKSARYSGDEDVPLDRLSQAERRWASIAIELACTRSRFPLLLLDEPEAALHRAAEQQMASALEHLATNGEARVVLASHSPDLLDARSASRVFVRRRSTEHSGLLVPFEESDAHTVDELGILPSDLLKRTRGFVLVEGEHDYQILHGHFGAELRRMGVEILPLRGAGRLKSALDARFLFEFTEARLFPLLDDVALAPLAKAWASAEARAKSSSLDDAIDQLVTDLQAMPGKGTEYYGAFLTTALRRGVDHRVVPLGVAETDILLYLPVDEIIPGASSWQGLREELRRDREGVQPTETEFKRWLEGAKRANLGAEHIGRVARSTKPHRELKALLAAISQALDPMDAPTLTD